MDRQDFEQNEFEVSVYITDSKRERKYTLPNKSTLGRGELSIY